MKNLVCVGILFFFCLARGQYHFSGNVSEENIGTSIYLSMVEDYRKSSRTYLDQIIKKVNVDSTGFFQFQGDNLPESNGIYRIHLDPCDADSSDMHFLGNCGNSPNVLFIASNKDTVQLPTSFEDQALCTINSTNPKSQLLLEIEGFKEEMIFDFTEYRSETNQKLNLEKWFATLQKHGETATEPLVELYIYDFLSDKKNETYGYYLQDLLQNPYYDMLLNRLEAVYPNRSFTKQYRAEITADKQMAGFERPPTTYWVWIVALLLAVSLSFNISLFLKQARAKKNQNALQKLTGQEQKIVDHIRQGKSNKEIAALLFVSHSTVKTHINNLYKKLNVSSREAILELLKE